MKKYVIFLLGCSVLISSCGVTSKSIKVSTPGYTASVDVYESSDPKKTKNEIAFILLHPKGGRGRGHSGVTGLASDLSQAGYTVYAPEMPWSPYTATLTEAFQFIDRIVNSAAKKHKKVFISGHSIGAAVAYLYCSAYKNTSKHVKGVILNAPGHLLQVSMRIQEATAVDVQRARKLVRQGKGDVKSNFRDFNQGSRFSISTTPRIYLSYFDPQQFPNPTENFDTFKVPVLWIDGKYDRAAARMGFENLYNSINKYSKYRKNLYYEVDADHVGVPNAAGGIITKWVQGL